MMGSSACRSGAALAKRRRWIDACGPPSRMETGSHANERTRYESDGKRHPGDATACHACGGQAQRKGRTHHYTDCSTCKSDGHGLQQELTRDVARTGAKC